MRRALTIARWTAIVVLALVVLAFIWWRTASIRVDPSTLDDLRAYAAPDGITLVGAWEPPGGMVLDRAEYRSAGGSYVVTLYSRPIANLRGETIRMFRVTLPTGASAPDSIVIDGRRGNAPLTVMPRPEPPDAMDRVEVEAVETGRGDRK